MKRTGNLYEKMVSDENIIRAIKIVNKSHRWFGNHMPNKTTMWVELTIDERVKELRQIIEDGFVPTQPAIKQRYDRNAKKWRDIAEPRLYPDQYVHHIMIQVLEPIMMRGMDYWCCGSIKGRGAHFGVNAMKKWMKNDVRNTRWCAELDIHHFYDSLKPEVVMDRMKQLIKDYKVLDLIERCLKFGVTIGAYFSQWFANTVLQPLDVIVRQHAKRYLRYMDNFTLFSNRKKDLIRAIKAISKWLEEHSLKLKGNWQYFRTRYRRPNALGYRYGRDHTIIRKHRLLSIKRQIKSYCRQKGNVSPKFAMSLLSRIGGLKHCNNVNAYKNIVPKGLQHKLKDVVREYQRKELTEWNTCLERFAETAKIVRT